MKYGWISCIFLLIVGKNYAQVVTGHVFEDRNRNGQWEVSEPGIRDIPVSNGEDIVRTDSKGKFVLRLLPGSSVFPILPAQYELSPALGKIQNAAFYYIPDTLPKKEVSFACVRRKPVHSFRVAAVGDIQVGNSEEVEYANQTIMPELMQQKEIDFHIFLGDLVNNEMTLLPVLKQMIAALPVASWTLPGNHDREVVGLDEKQDSSFNVYFGASTYAFNQGKVHFIILNNVFPKGKREYEGRLIERQIRFLENDLREVPEENLVVLCQHIPLAHMKDRDRILHLFRDRKVLVLSAHTHQISRHFFKDSVSRTTVHELTAGTVCGHWWVGEKDWQGIPAALMQCGSPKGYFVLDFQGKEYCIKYKGVGMDAARQMDIWVNGTDTLDRQVEAFQTLEGREVIANIYGGSDSTYVWLQVDQKAWIPMEPVQMVAPLVSRLNAWNKARIYPTRISRRGALRRKASPHLWKGYLPADLAPGNHALRIQAYDFYGLQVEGGRMIWIK